MPDQVEKVSKQLNLTTRHCLLNDFVSGNKSIKIVDQNAAEEPYMDLTISIVEDAGVSSVIYFSSEGGSHRLYRSGQGIVATEDGGGSINGKKSLTTIGTTSHAILQTDGNGNCSWFEAEGGDMILCASEGSLSWQPVKDCENACS